MSKKILVAYATQKGSTMMVARAIGDMLRQEGAVVDVLLCEEVTDLSSYKAVLVGSAVYNGAWLPEAIEFVEGHHRALNRIPVAVFALSLTMCDDSEKSRMTVLSYLDPILKMLPQVNPLDVGLFGGVFDPHQWDLFTRVVQKYVNHLPEGDFRDWQAVHDWTDYIRREILQQKKAA